MDHREQRHSKAELIRIPSQDDGKKASRSPRSYTAVLRTLAWLLAIVISVSIILVVIIVRPDSHGSTRTETLQPKAKAMSSNSTLGYGQNM